MPQKTNLNVNPYFEDFDASKNFYKILFRPGYSIQTRELTQIQSILQNQIESYGKYAFKQGDLVVPGEVGLNTRLDYVKLSSISEVIAGSASFSFVPVFGLSFGNSKLFITFSSKKSKVI